MTIIDFYGLPGSGKSTVSHKLAEVLRDKGYSVEEPSWTTDRMPSWKRLSLKMITSFAYCVCHIKTMVYIIEEASVFKLPPKTAIKLLVNTGYIMYMFTKKRDCDYSIFDQGLIQAVISLYTENNESTYYEMYKRLRQAIPYNTEPVYIVVDVSTAMERMLHRKDGKSRAEKLSKERKRRMLRRVSDICEGMMEFPTVYDNSNIGVRIDVLMNFILTGGHRDA